MRVSTQSNPPPWEYLSFLNVTYSLICSSLSLYVLFRKVPQMQTQSMLLLLLICSFSSSNFGYKWLIFKWTICNPFSLSQMALSHWALLVGKELSAYRIRLLKPWEDVSAEITLIQGKEQVILELSSRSSMSLLVRDKLTSSVLVIGGLCNLFFFKSEYVWQTFDLEEI